MTLDQLSLRRSHLAEVSSLVEFQVCQLLFLHKLLDNGSLLAVQLVKALATQLIIGGGGFPFLLALGTGLSLGSGLLYLLMNSVRIDQTEAKVCRSHVLEG